MNSTETAIVEKLAYDGPLSMPVVLTLALCLAALFAWALSRERSIIGLDTAIGFGVLRLIAIGTVLWMLLAPVNVTTETSSTRQAVAIIADVSGSMRTIDPMGTADELRWAAAGDESLAPTVTESIDRAIAALGRARAELIAAIRGIAEHRDQATVAKHASATQTAIDRAKENLAAVSNAEGLRSLSGAEANELEQRRQTASQMLDGSEFAAFAELAALLANGKAPAQTHWRESLPDLEQRMLGISATLQELAQLWQRAETPVLQQDAPRWAALSQQSRLERVGGFLESFKHSALDSVARDVDVLWSQFDTSITQMTLPQSPKQSLAQGMQTDMDIDQTATGTNLTSVLEALRQLQLHQPLAAAFILSDVAHNETGVRERDGASAPHSSSSEPAEVAASLVGTPVYVIPIGNPRRVRDVNLVAVEAPPVAMRNDDIVIEAHIEAYQCAGERCIVQLIEDSEVIDFREFEIDSDFISRTVRFGRRVPEVGQQTFHISVQPLPGELSELNNDAAVDVNVMRSEIKVLLADEIPRWEYRYLAQLFRRDAKVDCDELLFRPRLIATGKREQSRSFPASVDEWDQYDVVILGDVSPERMPDAAQESLVQYLRERGGTLILIAGDAAMPQRYVDRPLEDVVPVQPATTAESSAPGAARQVEYAFRVTEEGQSHVALMIGETQQDTRAAWEFVNRFAPLHELSIWRRPKPLARNLIAAAPRRDRSPIGPATDESTFLCWQPVGRGRAVYLSGPDTYRLRFLRGDQLHYRFWGQLLRWAIASDLTTGSKFVRVRSDKTRYETGDTVRLELRLFDGDGNPIADARGIEFELKSDSDERNLHVNRDPDIPGLYHADFRATKPGTYQVRAAGELVTALQAAAADETATVSFTVQGRLPTELIDTRCNRVLAAQIAEVTGGQVLPPAAVAEILGLTDLEPIVTETIKQKPLWAQWKYLWLVFGCLQIEWTIRKWRGFS